MSTTFTTTRAIATAASKPDNVDVEISEIKTPMMYSVDDLLFNRSQTIPDIPLVGYPATARGRSDYVHYTARDLDRFADHEARKYASLGIEPKVETLSNRSSKICLTSLRVLNLTKQRSWRC
jgi:hypothetical protein